MEGQNPWWAGEKDEAYEEWLASEIRWVPEIVDRIAVEPFSLHFLVGARQVGKTTALKIFIQRLLERGFDPKSIFYYSCDEIVDHRELGELVDTYISARKEWGIRSSVIILDEITFVEEWWRAIKSRIDRRLLKNDVLLITGSASMELVRQKEMFPGRRGKGRDFTLHPLDFSRYAEIFGGLKLKKAGLKKPDQVERCMRANRIFSEKLHGLFLKYLKTGGFPLPVVQYFSRGKVSAGSLRVYLDWLRGDWQRAGRSDRYMKEVVSYILQTRLSPVSWLGIARETSISSPHTSQAYVETLENLLVAIVLHILSPQKKVMYRKNKKIHIADPAIYHAFETYVGVEVLDETMVESAVVSHLSRTSDVYYWRNASEVDAVCLLGDQQIGFEVKWGITGKWRKPRHLHKAFLLERDEIPIFLASVDW
jgi:hypothetical protein